ncbi:MAG: serine hydrolase domain-containing protein, partial [Bacteroidota bacterium]
MSRAHDRLLWLFLLVLVAVPVQAQTGPDVPEMATYDAYFLDFLDRYGIPGASVAVSRFGRLVYARGFGLADVDAAELVEPTDRFRVASVSKPITAVVTMKLVEDGRLDLDAPAFAFLDDLPAPDGQADDPRLAQVTVRDLLQHSGGWDRDGTVYDPMFDAVNIATAMGVPPPADVETIVRFMRGRPLDFDPGTRYAYSNFGVAVLGRVLERATGTPYAQLVKETLAATGITSFEIGGSRLADRLPGEVRYYSPLPEVPSVFGDGLVPWPYGGYHIEAMDAHGGWVASAPDLLRFTTALDGIANRPDVLASDTRATMVARPDLATWNGSSSWYGLGWSSNANGHWWHLGSLPGAESLLVRSSYNGLHWAVLINTRTNESGTYMAELDQAMWNLALGITSWPTHDLFDIVVADEGQPSAATLALDTYPNPTLASATVAVTLPAATDVRAEVVDLLGRRVATLHDGPLAAGTHP